MTDNSLLHVARSWQFLCVISLTFACPAITQLRLFPSLSLHLPLACCAKVINRNAWIMQFSCLHLRGQLTKKKADNNALHLAAAAAARTDSSNKGE